MKFRMMSSYKGALALVCLSVRKNWRKSEMNSDNLFLAALAVDRDCSDILIKPDILIKTKNLLSFN